jgi:hypothetical protein
MSEHGTVNIGLWTCDNGLVICFFDAIFLMVMLCYVLIASYV